MRESGGSSPELVVVVADDEGLARGRVVELLREYPSMRVARQCASGPETLDAIQRIQPDLLFLDVQMPGMSGFDVLAELDPNERPAVVFCTAYDEYALEAFEVNAVDYLLKPYADERFHESLARARLVIGRAEEGLLRDRVQRLLQRVPTVLSTTPRLSRHGYLERFAVPVRGRWVVVATRAVDWIEASGDYATLHVGDDTYLVRGTMTALDRRLDPTRFLRIHRSTIVNLERVRAVHGGEHGDYEVELDGGLRRRVGRSYRDEVLEQLGVRG